MTFDAEAAELEGKGDGEPDDDAEEESPPAALLQVVRTVGSAAENPVGG